MALTDKSAIPLNAHDLRVVEGERRILDRRLNLRLGYGRGTTVRLLIERNKEDFEARFGPMHRRDASVQFPQGGRHFVAEYWLTKGQALWVCRKSDARNADDVMEEIIKVFLAIDAGVPLPATPLADALLAPDKPTVTRGDANVVRVTHEEPLRWQRESEQDDIQAGDLFEAPHPNQWSPSYDTWRERTIESTLPRPTGFLDTIGKIGRTPQGYGDSTEDKPTMFLRDELPIGHSADSWRVWVSEQWFRLPLDLRQRWWRDTEYGNRPPSDEMIQAIIFIALP
jgi:hypothetical protein